MSLLKDVNNGTGRKKHIAMHKRTYYFGYSQRNIFLTLNLKVLTFLQVYFYCGNILRYASNFSEIQSKRLDVQACI